MCQSQLWIFKTLVGVNNWHPYQFNQKLVCLYEYPELTYDKIVGVLTDCRTKPIKEFSQGFVHNVFALTAGHDSFLRKRRAERAWKKIKTGQLVFTDFQIYTPAIPHVYATLILNCIIIFSAAFWNQPKNSPTHCKKSFWFWPNSWYQFYKTHKIEWEKWHLPLHPICSIMMWICSKS